MLYLFFMEVSMGESWVSWVVDGKACMQGLVPCESCNIFSKNCCCFHMMCRVLICSDH